MERKKGQTVHKEARNMVRRVIRKCDEEAKEGTLLHPISQSNARASDYTGVSMRTISRVRKEDSMCDEEELLASPGKKRPKYQDPHKFVCSEEDRKIIRDIIFEFYTVRKVAPSGPKLLAAVKERLHFPWRIHTLRNLLKNMGYEWRKCQTVRRLLIERPNIVAWRSKYLKAIQYHRNLGREIVYLDETWVDNSTTLGRCWQSEDTPAALTNNSPSQRFVIAHAGSKNGFINDAALVFESWSVTGDDRGQMDSANFEIWLREKLIPNLPENCIIVMDNAPCHSVELNKAPTKYARKQEMISWLVENNVPHAETMRKFELCDLISRNRKPEKTFKADETMKLTGHLPLRLPPHTCDLNPMKLVWAKLRRTIRESTISTPTSSEFEQFAYEALRGISPDDWAGYCSHVEKLEREYWERDGILEEATERCLLPADEDDTDTSATDSDSDSEDYEDT